MIGYAVVGSNDIPRALAFYDSLLTEAGGKRMLDMGERGCIYSAEPGRPMLGVMRPYDGTPASVGNGMMVALAADDRAMVDRLHAKALELGGTDEGAPGPRGGDESPAYFAYFRDLDGNKLAAFYWAMS